jgi:hypothetical protein
MVAAASVVVAGMVGIGHSAESGINPAPVAFMYRTGVAYQRRLCSERVNATAPGHAVSIRSA